MTTDTLFPKVQCSRHGDGDLRPGYVVCAHILEQDDLLIAHFQTPTNTQLGEVLCSHCFIDAQCRDQLQLVCHDCVQDILSGREYRQ